VCNDVSQRREQEDFSMQLNRFRRFVLFFLLCIVSHARASEPTTAPAVDRMLDPHAIVRWVGLDDHAALKIPGTATFTYPAGEKGFYKHGFRLLNDSTRDWSKDWGLRIDLDLPDNSLANVSLAVSVITAHRGDAPTTVSAAVQLTGAGRHVVTLPWTAFAIETADRSFLRYVQGVAIDARPSGDGAAGQIRLNDVSAVAGACVALQCDVRGKSAPQGQTVQYTVQVNNCTDQSQAVALSTIRYGWNVMNATVEPSSMTLAPGQSESCLLRVEVSSRVPPGGHEPQILQAIANGDAAAASTLSFITVSELPHPYIIHTPQRWQAVCDKVKQYPWAKTAADKYIATAAAWDVPEVAKPPHNDPDDTMGPFLFRTQVENDLLACGYAWQLTGEKQYAQKIATFLHRLSDPGDGYPVTLRGCNQSLVQEGHFFQHIAMAYDMIGDANILSEADRERIEATFRIFMATIEREDEHGSISNWNLSENCGAFYCCLAMQDLAAAELYFSGPSGIEDQLAKGTMDDGWWYECSISYNMWCASEFTQVALAYEPFGFNFRTAWVPASYSQTVLLHSQLNGGSAVVSDDAAMRNKPFGMDPDLFGPNRRPYRTITDLWNSLLPFISYRGVMFGVNDSTENQVTGNRTEVSGQPFEIAYFAYRDPRYASIIKMGDPTGKGIGRDLLYGVPELPEQTPENYRDSAYADNVGLAMLRSQHPNRPIREQIQAVLHYGTHGWAHGHFDRTDLLSLMRYGRSFWNPESVFWVYEPFMYKFYCQTSINHNMVVVDEKMQEATPGKRLLFHTGKLMQTTAVETTARWSNPPYGGMVYDYVPVKTFAEKCWREGASVPIPDHLPAYGSLTDFSEPILQRRLMIVTGDYVVVADHLHGTRPHTFENLLQLKGFGGIDASKKQFLRHDAQWNADPIGSAQFVTDCDWYSADAPAVGHFVERWGPGADNEGSRSNGNQDGALKLDVHTLWPKEQQIMVGTSPEQHDVNKRVFYTVRGDGKTLVEGRFGAWILGQAPVDVSIDGLQQLELQTHTELSKKPTLFWANARIVTRDGKELPLSQLKFSTDNVVPQPPAGQDYFGGPIKIVGESYSQAAAAEPKDEARPGIVRIDLAGIDAVRFKCVLGGDYPPGDESQRRKTYAVRSTGTDADFLTVIEPFESTAVIKSAQAMSADSLSVSLSDGRTQTIQIHGMAGDGHDLGVDFSETTITNQTQTEATTAGDLSQ
jgi:hypothetical protein